MFRSPPSRKEAEDEIDKAAEEHAEAGVPVSCVEGEYFRPYLNFSDRTRRGTFPSFRR